VEILPLSDGLPAHEARLRGDLRLRLVSARILHGDLVRVDRIVGNEWGNGQLLDHFHADLKALKIPLQRQYENRSTFRNLLLRAGAQEFHVNLMTHAPVKQASDYYTRLEMQWPAMCEAILRLRLPEVTGEVTGDGKRGKKRRASEPETELQNGGVYGTRTRGLRRDRQRTGCGSEW
jgi:hypothetical protein